MKTFTRPLLWLLLPLLLAASCKPQAPVSPPSKYALNFDPGAKAIATAWKNDPWGCNKERTADKAEALVATFMKNKPSEQQVIELLGPPEQTKDIDGTRNLVYVFDGTCEKGKLKPGSVFCLLTLTIGLDVNLLDSGGVVCG
jgi:hypothetical protein